MLSESLQQYLMIGVAAFVAGYLVAMLGRVVSQRLKKTIQDPRDHQIRALEADVRNAERQAGDFESKVNDSQAQLKNAVGQIRDMKASLQKADSEMIKLKEDLKISCAKTVELRQELTDRAEQTIRGAVQLDDLKTELQVAKAGTDAVLDEINRLNQEDENESDMVDPRKLVTDE
jgi:chromosome segregation ATPase